MLCGGPKSLPVIHHDADYILWSFGINERMLVCFEYTNDLERYLLEIQNSKFETSRPGLIESVHKR